MPRRRLILTDQFPYHITSRANNKKFFTIPLPQLWSIFNEIFSYLIKEYQINIHSFVLMDNHYHLIVSTPNSDLSAVMTYLNRETAKRANKFTGQINHFFGGKYKWSVITTEFYYLNALKYVFQNPVDAKICKNVQDYSFSSLNVPNKYFKTLNIFTLEKKEIELNLNWLNTTYDEESKILIKEALDRKIFKFVTPTNKSKKIISNLKIQTPNSFVKNRRPLNS